MTYAIFKEIDGKFVPTGETVADLASVAPRLAELAETEGGCYSANESVALEALYAEAAEKGVSRDDAFNPKPLPKNEE